MSAPQTEIEKNVGSGSCAEVWELQNYHISLL